MFSLAVLGRPACVSCRARITTLTYPRRLSSAAANSGFLGSQRNSQGTRTRLPSQPARTRFAPSPTGYLHLGSLRTALYNYLLARATNGQFLLRLEDTDQSRIVADAEARLYQDLAWAGIAWDEGPDCGGPYGPYKQSQRLSIYREHADRLLQEGKAFRCFCSHDDLAAHHQQALEMDGMFGVYPGTCLTISAAEAAERAANGEAHTVRFRSSSSPITVYDIVYGVYRKKLPEDHFIIMKSDGFPTYHFANVVDDHLMAITHVIRGAEWLVSTAKHVSIYDAFGWELPQFAHVGLLVNTDRQKLSKRSMDIGIDSYKQAGIPPPALLNFAALLGWNPGNSPNKGVMTLDDMVDNFGLKFTKGDIVVNMEKLAFFHRKHIRIALEAPSPGHDVVDSYVIEPVLQRVYKIEAKRQASLIAGRQNDVPDSAFLSLLGEPVIGLAPPNMPSVRDRLRTVLKISRSEATDASTIVDENKYLIWQPSTRHIQGSYCHLLEALDPASVGRAPSMIVSILGVFIDRLGRIDDPHWTAGNIQSVLDTVIKHGMALQGEKPLGTAWYKTLRWALLGLDSGPQISHLMEYLGKTGTMRRMHMAQSVACSELSSGQEGQ